MNKKKAVSEKLQPTVAFADALREALAMRGVSRSELARMIKRSPSAVSNYCIGRDMPGPATVFAIEVGPGAGSRGAVPPARVLPVRPEEAAGG